MTPEQETTYSRLSSFGFEYESTDEAEASAIQWAMQNNPGCIVVLVTSLEIEQEPSK